MTIPPADAAVRTAALDSARSFIVRAPAGSGKTELLTRRFLTLLAVVERPEEVMAITFTRKAAQEMRRRIMEALEKAEKGEEGDPGRTVLAREALVRSRVMGWELPLNPARLNILTIDGLMKRITALTPWLSRLGPAPGVAADSSALLGEAAARVVRHADSGDSYSRAVIKVLEHLDNRADNFAGLLIKFLLKRDQWQRRPGGSEGALVDPSDLVDALGELVGRRLYKAVEVLRPHLPEMALLARYGSLNLPDNATLKPYEPDVIPDPVPENARHYRVLAGFFLTANGNLRKKHDARTGFATGGGEKAEKRERMTELLRELDKVPGAKEALNALSTLPDPAEAYENGEIIDAVVKVAELALAHLWLVMKEKGSVDFTGNALAALSALGPDEDPTGVALALDTGISHILVDEFQDTSLLQLELLRKLTRGWAHGDGRTLFIVGDPMQSIYRFREARVELFEIAEREGIGEIPLQPLTLKVNFRSDETLVGWQNENLPLVFPSAADTSSGAVAFGPALAENPGGLEEPVIFTPSPSGDPAIEAGEVVERIRALKKDHPDWSVAVLVRARPHLKALTAAIKDAGLTYRGEELNPLKDEPSVMDAASLARALAGPADRLSWLAVLRAPWCGLTLTDLHALVNGDMRPVPMIIDEEGWKGKLTADGAARLERVWPWLAHGLQETGRGPFAPLVRRVWTLLGAPAYLSRRGMEDADSFFALLEEVSGNSLPDPGRLDQRLLKLYAAPDPEGDEKLQIMTIHKAKGLEFDAVILPGLGKPPRRRETELIVWEESERGGIALGVARRKDAGTESPVTDFLRKLDDEREVNERVRLAYVAVTRAKRAVYLWGHAGVSGKNGERKPASGSLLETLWPVFSGSFEGLTETAQEPGESARPQELAVERLPGGWALPGFESPSFGEGGAEVSGEESKAEEDRPAYDWALEERKVIGTVAHLIFERMASEGPDGWDMARIESMRGTVSVRLTAAGVAAGRVEKAADEVLEAARSAILDPVCRAILSPGPGALSEFAITAGSEKGVKTRRIDRTYVDGDGVRWVVDFKMTAHEGGDLEGFLAAQKERHRAQLAEYVELMRLMEPGRTVRAAVYYPLMRRLVEIV